MLPPQPKPTTSLVLDASSKFYDLLHKKARYKVYWGGRGSGKTQAVAEALIRKASTEAVRILCCREVQLTIRDSSHRVLKDTISRLGLDSWFTVTNDSIKSKAGAEFVFRGLHNNADGLRSLEGIDICWVEEAQTVTEASWRSLVPTIRKEYADGSTSEIWITFNLITEDDATYVRFVANPRKNSVVHKVNYDSNPFFPQVLRDEMEDDRRVDYHLYEHIWLGLPLKIDNSIIFSGKYVVEEFPDDLWQKAERLYFGADFGFAQDPSTLIRCFIVDSTLYVEYEAYGTGVELDEMAEFYASVPGSKDWPIKADCARPETISHIRRTGGYNIDGAEKWDGCVKDGIAHIRKFKRVVIHPRCVKTAEEARLYRYKVDKRVLDAKGNPTVLPIIVDKHNHCWDAIRYSLDGHIQRSGEIGIWQRLGSNTTPQD